MPDESQDNTDYGLPIKKGKTIQPLHSPEDNDPALSLIRQKIHTLYEEEPEATEELQASEYTVPRKRSKHQQYMHELSGSGLSLAEIQTNWHEYYQSLPDHEKHEVWKEFYEQHDAQAQAQPAPAPTQQSQEEKPQQQPTNTPAPTRLRSSAQENVQDIREKIRYTVASQSTKHRANIKSLVFGLGMGAMVLLIALFGFFNERFIAPFITPSRVLSSTPLIIDGDTPVGTDPKIIIPKINVEVPVVYGESSIQEDDVQQALEEGILHYPTTAEPGEKGNSVFFGHSSNNIFNRGEYKFAFVLLNQLQESDTFMLEKNGTRYIYRIFETRVVAPTDLSVLDTNPERESIATLITCDPPGTSINRLVVFGEQISPDPSGNDASTAPPPSQAPQPEQLPSDAPSLWSRIF